MALPGKKLLALVTADGSSSRRLGIFQLLMPHSTMFSVTEMLLRALSIRYVLQIADRNR